MRVVKKSASLVASRSARQYSSDALIAFDAAFSVFRTTLSLLAALRCPRTASAAGPSHASHGLASENAQRWKRNGWNWRPSFAV